MNFLCKYLFFAFRAAGLFFFSAFFVNLLVGILFLLGANVAVVCDDVSDYKLLQKVFVTQLEQGKVACT